MAIMCLHHELGVTPEVYDAVRTAVNWEGLVPPGAVAHFIGFRDGSAAEVNVWESRAAYEAYRDTRLKPVLERMRIVIDEPEIIELHMGAVGAPALEGYLVPRALRPAVAPA